MGYFTPETNDELAAKYNPQSIPIAPIKSLEEVLLQREQDKPSGVTRSVLTMLRRYKRSVRTIAEAQQFIDWLLDGNRAPSTVDRYLDVLKVVSPLFKEITVKRPHRPDPKPFTQQEVSLILQWFQTHQPQYHDIILCLFLTGMRTSEAIGLRWQHIDFNDRCILISESMPDPQRNGRRVRKDTKTGIPRRFPLSGTLLELFTRLHSPTCGYDDLIFTTDRGKPIDDHHLSQRYWKKCLIECNIPHRSLYNTRHTFISHFLHKTKDVVACASLTHGSRSGAQTILTHYAGILERVEVPELY